MASKIFRPSGVCLCRNDRCKVPFGLCHCGCKRETKVSRKTYSNRNAFAGMPCLFIHGHKTPKSSGLSLKERRARTRKKAKPINIPIESHLYADPDMRFIKLTENFSCELSEFRETVVEFSDYEKFGNLPYRLVEGYALRKTEDGKYASLHRDIMGHPKGMKVDHINGNPLDNRKSNLRICTNRENLQNHRLSPRNKSGYSGVYWNDRCNSWIVTIGVDGKLKYLGSYKSKEDAIMVRIEAEKKYYGEFAPHLRSDFTSYPYAPTHQPRQQAQFSAQPLL